MTYSILKIIVSSLIIVVISELVKRSSFLGALIASLPIVSILAMIWIYNETRDSKAIASLSIDIFWLVIPSLFLFSTLPVLLNRKINFYLALAISCILTIVGYYLMILLLKKMGR